MCVTEMNYITEQPSKGALVECFDRDPANGDDAMCEGLTGDDGCVTMQYKKQNWDYSPVGNLGNPDIYCVVNKMGFVQSVPADKDNWDQDTLAKFKATLYRDRTNDYGATNKCGPEWAAKLGINDLVTSILPFDEQCFQHDKCYWDCQILQASGYNHTAAQHFCDKEMYDGMLSTCHYNRGQFLDNGEDLICIRAAKTIYDGLRLISGAYNIHKDNECNGNQGSWKNDYINPPKCVPDGQFCGYDGTTVDDLDQCKWCCAGSNIVAKDEGYVWDDWFCKCLPSGKKCDSNEKDQCCKGYKEDCGWFFCDYYCK